MLEHGYHDVPPGKIAVVITYMEMYAPQLRGASLPDGLTFVEIKPDVHAYRKLFRRVGEDWLWYGRTLLSDATLSDILNHPDTRTYTLLKDGQAEALLELDFREEGKCEIAYFGVTAPLIGTGAGSYLMDRAIEIAFAAPINQLQLNTCTIDSPQALGFYQSSGFTAVKRQVEIADDPRLKYGYDRALGPHVPILEP